jgi:DNA invertase Pin-like site-specific DNA recombinase
MAAKILINVEVVRRYSNRSDLLEQLRKMAMIMADRGRYGEAGMTVEINTASANRSRRLRDRLSPEDHQTIIDLYRSGTRVRQIAEKFSVSLRSVKRLLREHGIRREGRAAHT